jgi:hypothetical protein
MINTKRSLLAKISLASLIVILLFWPVSICSKASRSNRSNYRKSAKRLQVGRPSPTKLQIAGPLTEEFSFLIEDFKMEHQSALNNLNITIRYRYTAGIADSDYPDFRLILNDIKIFLTRYPNAEDYWEIVNKRLTCVVLKKYMAISSITSEIHVSPSRTVPYSRSSIITRSRASLMGDVSRKSSCGTGRI